MAWELTITHIDVQGPGDAALIVARDGAGTVRSVLIDGGLFNAARLVDAALARAGIGAVDVVVATHFDRDHFGGLRALLTRQAAAAVGTGRFGHCRVVDQGQPNRLPRLPLTGLTAQLTSRKRPRDGDTGDTRAAKRARTGDGAPDPSWADAGETGCGEDAYQRYRTAIENIDGCVRITAGVLSEDDTVGPSFAGRDLVGRGWLVGQEIMWNGHPTGIPPGAPRLTCVAANQIVRTTSGPTLVSTTEGVDPRNPKSLAFLLSFGGFRYFTGGDLESPQEDALAAFLQVDNPEGRVHVLKAGHHGSRHSTSAAFLDRIRPQAVVFSCGRENLYGHPHVEVVERVEAVGGDTPCVENYFLTGEDLRKVTKDGDPVAEPGERGVVAGVWFPEDGSAPPEHHGDVTVSVTAAGAARSPVEYTVRCWAPEDGVNTGREGFSYHPCDEWDFEFPATRRPAAPDG